MYDIDEDDEVFLTNEIEVEIEKELWSSPLMNYTSPFDDYRDLYADIDVNKPRHSSNSKLPIPLFPSSKYFTTVT